MGTVGDGDKFLSRWGQVLVPVQLSSSNSAEWEVSILVGLLTPLWQCNSN